MLKKLPKKNIPVAGTKKEPQKIYKKLPSAVPGSALTKRAEEMDHMATKRKTGPRDPHILDLKILNSITDLFITLNNDWQFTFINRTAELFLNKSTEEVLGQNIWEVMPSYAATPFYKYLTNAMKTRRPAEFEFRDPRTGQWYHYRLFPSKEVFTILANDITERKLAAELILQSRERYQTFISQSVEGIWRFEIEKPVSSKLAADAQLTEMLKHTFLAECNCTIAQRYGYATPEEITGTSMEKLFRGTRLIKYLPLFISSGYRLSNVLVKEKTGDGGVKYFLNNMVGITENGFLKRIWGTKRDVTEQKLTEMSLKETQQKLNLSLSAGQVSTWLWNIAENKVEWSGGQTLLYGMDCPQQCTLEDWLNLIHPDDARKLQQDIHDSITSKKEMNTEFRVVWPDESIHWILFKCIPEYDESGEAFRLIGINIDITDRILAEKEKENFIDITSHELKTPLTSIKVYADILTEKLRRKNDAELTSLAEKMSLQIDRLTNLIKDLLDVTKINEGQLSLACAYFDLNELIKEVTEEMQRTATTHQLIITGNITRQVWADKDRIREVLVNFISNAIKYSPGCDRVLIRVSTDERNLTVSVKDFGIGLSEEDRSKLFRKFYRANDSGVHTFPGVGLGLYISAEIIKKHNGKIWVESVKNEGSEFYFSLALPAE